MCLLDKDTPPFVYQWGKKNFHRETLHLSKKKKKREVKRGFGRLACPLNFW